MRDIQLLSLSEVENILVDCGETVPEDYQGPECDLMWKVVKESLKRLKEKMEENYNKLTVKIK